jgi:hypothetical protein
VNFANGQTDKTLVPYTSITRDQIDHRSKAETKYILTKGPSTKILKYSIRHGRLLEVRRYTYVSAKTKCGVQKRVTNESCRY